MRLYQYAAALAVLWAASHALYGADETIDALKKQIQELDQKVHTLEINSDLRNQGPETGKAGEPKLSAGADGFSFSSANSNFVLRVHGYLQADARFYVDDHIPANDTFLMRRVRPIFDGNVFKNYDFKIMLNFASGISSTAANNAFLDDAYLNIHYWEQFQIQAGKMKEPVGLERLRSGANLLFVERGLPTALVPNRDVGIMLHGQILDEVLAYQTGIFNGVQDAAAGDSDVGIDDHKDLAARLFAQPFKNSKIRPLQGLGFGIAGTWGNQQGTLPSFKTAGQQTFFSYVTGAGTNVNVTADGDHWRLAPQGYYYWGPFGVFGEYVISNQKVRRDVGGSPTSYTRPQNKAWQVAGSWLFGGEANSYSRVKPLHALSFDGTGLGAVELAARYGELTVDDDLFVSGTPGGSPLFASAVSARKVRSWGVGANWYLNRNVKLTLDYEQTDFKGGSTAPRAVTAQDERVIMSRMQLSF